MGRLPQRAAPTDICNTSNASPASLNVGGRPVPHLLAEINIFTSPRATAESDALIHTVAIRAAKLREDLATTHTIC